MPNTSLMCWFMYSNMDASSTCPIHLKVWKKILTFTILVCSGYAVVYILFICYSFVFILFICYAVVFIIHLLFSCLYPVYLLFSCLYPVHLLFNCLYPVYLLVSCLYPVQLLFSCLYLLHIIYVNTFNIQICMLLKQLTCCRTYVHIIKVHITAVTAVYVVW